MPAYLAAEGGGVRTLGGGGGPLFFLVLLYPPRHIVRIAEAIVERRNYCTYYHYKPFHSSGVMHICLYRLIARARQVMDFVAPPSSEALWVSRRGIKSH